MIQKTFIFVFILKIASCWWDVGHMVTAQIAELELKNKNLTIYNRVNELVLILNPLTLNTSHTFVEAAAWPDDIKDKPMNFWDNWHYYDRPVNPSGSYIMLDYTQGQSNSIDCLNRATVEL